MRGWRQQERSARCFHRALLSTPTPTATATGPPSRAACCWPVSALPRQQTAGGGASHRSATLPRSPTALSARDPPVDGATPAGLQHRRSSTATVTRCMPGPQRDDLICNGRRRQHRTPQRARRHGIKVAPRREQPRLPGRPTTRVPSKEAPKCQLPKGSEGKDGKEKKREKRKSARAAKERSNVWKGEKIIWNRNAPAVCLERKERESLGRKVHGANRKEKRKRKWKRKGGKRK